MQALIFEGRADDPARALDLLRSGAVKLQPAQDHGIVTPLAQVVSSSMLLVAVELRGEISFAPLVESPAPALRFGSMAPDCLLRLREFGECVVSAVGPIVRRRPPAIEDVIAEAVAAGDDCHARTAVANESLISRLGSLDADCAALLRGNPSFVLPVLMAAAAAVLRSSRCDIEAIGGNGIDFGLRRRAERTWRQTAAQPPCGTRLDGLDDVTPLPAIGDSAVIDFCGLGGQALAAAPSLATEFSRHLPADALTRYQVLIDPRSGIVDPARVTRSARALLINLAILDATGTVGLIGRGFYSPPVALFHP